MADKKVDDSMTDETFTVSYTHLDVYKRQNCTYWYTENQHVVLGKQLSQPGVIFLVMESWVLGFFYGIVKAENYLQMLSTYVVLGFQSNYDNFNTLYFRHDGATPHYARAVSYTHLDVYKRQV